MMPSGPAQIAEQVEVLVVRELTEELRSVRLEALNGVVDVSDGKHELSHAEGVDRPVSSVTRGSGAVELAQLKSAVTIRRDHHGDLAQLTREAGAGIGELPLDHLPPF